MGEDRLDAGAHRLTLVGHVLFGADRTVQEWMARRIDGYQINDKATALGVWKDERLVAGVSFEGYNGVHVTASIAAEPGSGWASRETLRTLFGYPFHQLGCKAISVTVPMSNLPSLNLATGLGFKPEAIVDLAAPDGGALIVLKLFKDECRWTDNGQGKQRTAAA